MYVEMMAPSGAKIRGTLDRVDVVARGTVLRNQDGEIWIEHDGDSEVDWDSQETVTICGEKLYVCEDGEVWIENQLVPAPEEPEAPEEPRAATPPRNPRDWATYAAGLRDITQELRSGPAWPIVHGWITPGGTLFLTHLGGACWRFAEVVSNTIAPGYSRREIEVSTDGSKPPSLKAVAGWAYARLYDRAPAWETVEEIEEMRFFPEADHVG